MESFFMVAQPERDGQAKSLPNIWERRRTAVFIVLHTPPSLVPKLYRPRQFHRWILQGEGRYVDPVPP